MVARLVAVGLDTDAPAVLAAFYGRLAGLELLFESEDFIALKGAGFLLTVHRVGDHRPPRWPSGDPPKQLHLDFAVDDLDAAQDAALALGARLPEVQPSPERWRVLLDPAGHPFCLTTLVPDV
jgi:hypothetical protein